MKKLLIAASFGAFFCGIALFLPSVQSFALDFAENQLLHRQLEMPQKWIFEMQFCGVFLAALSILTLAFRKKIAKKFEAIRFYNVTRGGARTVRASNFELLRCFAMLGIIAHHINQHGIDIYAKTLYSFANPVSKTFYFFGAFGNYIFMLISGWFLPKSKFSRKKWLSIYGVLLFWTLFIGLLHFFRHVALFGFDAAEMLRLLKSFTPFLQSSNWYASAYLIFYVFSPIFSAFANGCSQKEHKTLCAASLVLLCVFPLLPLNNVFHPDQIFQFFALFLAGSYLQKYSPKFFENPRRNLIFAASIFAYYLVFCVASSPILDLSIFQKGMSRLFNPIKCPAWRIFAAAAFFCAFRDLKIAPSKFINLCGGCTFAIYIIHETPASYGVWNNFFHIQKFVNSPAMPLAVFGVALFAFFFGVFLEVSRKKLCRLFAAKFFKR